MRILMSSYVTSSRGSAMCWAIIFIGAYLQGSFAVGDFDIYSDVDFLILLEEDISGEHLPPLQVLHADIFKLDCPWAQHLEGSYIPNAELARRPPPRRKFLYLDHGSTELVRSAHDDSLVVYWSLRERGITLNRTGTAWFGASGAGGCSAAGSLRHHAHLAGALAEQSKRDG